MNQRSHTGWLTDMAERIAQLERDLAAAQAERDDANKECGFRIGERDEARAERDKWKAMAEWQYGVRVYPHDMSLRKGALDAYIKTWSPDAAIDAAHKER